MAVNVGVLRAVLELKDQFSGPLRGATQGTADAERGFGRLSTTAGRVTTAFTAFGTALTAIGVSKFVSELVQAEIQMQKISTGLTAATGSSKQAAKEFAFVTGEAKRLGLNLQSSAADYTRLAAAARGTSLEGLETRRIFLGIAEASTTLGLSADEASGALKAIEQMISKGKVSAEELRQQLGERLPGAFQLAAKAMGVTTAQLDDMLRKGEVTAGEMLPKLATELHKAFGPSAQEAAGNLQQAINRFKTEVFEAKGAINDGLIPGISALIGWATKLMDAFNSSFGFIRGGFAILQGFIADVTAEIVNQFFAVSIAAAKAMGALIDMVPGMENPFREGIAQLEQWRDSAVGFLRDLADGFRDVAVDQFAKDLQQTTAAMVGATRAATADDGLVSALDQLIDRGGRFADILEDRVGPFLRDMPAQMRGLMDLGGFGGPGTGDLFFGGGNVRDVYSLAMIDGVKQVTDEQINSVATVERKWIQAAGAAAGAIVNFLRGSGDAGSALSAVGGAFGGVLGGTGPWGAVASLGLSVAGGLIGDLFGSEEMSAAEKVARSIGFRMGEELAQSLIDTANAEFGGDRSAAFHFMLGDILRDETIATTAELQRFASEYQLIIHDVQRGALTGGQAIEAMSDAFEPLLENAIALGDTATFQQLAASTSHVLRSVADGTYSLAQANQLLDETFEDLADSAREFGNEGLRAVRGIINQARAAGEEFEAITKFIEDGVSQMADAVRLVLDSGVASTGDLRQAAMGITLAFREAVLQGLDLGQVVEDLRPLVLDLIAQFQAMGVEVPEHLQRTAGFLRKLADEDVQALLMNLKGVGGIIEASIALAIPPTQAAFENFQQTIEDTRQSLLDQGLTGKQAIEAMLPQLLDAARLARDFGFELDEDIAKMLEAAGIDMSLIPPSEIEVLLDGFDDVVASLDEIIRLLGGIPGQFRDITREAKAFAGVNYPTPPSPGGLGTRPGFAGGTPGTSYLDFGSGSSAVLHGREAVVTQAQGASLAGQIGAAIQKAQSGEGEVAEEIRGLRRELAYQVAIAVKHELQTARR